MLKLGLIVNPFAGIGGSVALKGSDGAQVRAQALALGAELRAAERCKRALGTMGPDGQHIFCWGGSMGADSCAELGVPHTVVGHPATATSEAADTVAAVKALAEQSLDLLVFVGGDGTARDVLDALGDNSTLPVLGIPSGVKMHSGVFAVSPEAGGEVLQLLVRAGLVNVAPREVRDIDEAEFRQGRVRSRYYGELLVPEVGGFLQHTKIAGIESEEMVAAEIAADVVEGMQPETLYIIGPGSTTAAITETLGLQGALLGVDAVAGGQLLGSDLTATELEQLVDSWTGPVALYITAIGGQGHILGRGNQQLSPALLRSVGIDNVTVVAAKGKIAALQGRPLLVDSNDAELDLALVGYRRVVTGYHDAILYPVAAPG